MKRAILVVLIAANLVAAHLAFAQSGACPPGTIAITPPTPTGTWPSDTLICRDTDTEGERVEIYNDDGYACEGQGVTAGPLVGFFSIYEPRAIYVPPAGRNIVDEDGYTRFRFEFWSYGVQSVPRDIIHIKIEYWGPDNVRRAWKIITTGNYTMITAPTPPGVPFPFPQYYNVFLIDEEILVHDNNGYFTVRPLQENLDPPFADMGSWYIASWQAGATDDNFPAFCPIPGGTLPATPTPSPTLTPTPTPTGAYNTPTPSRTPTPYTPAATSPGGTPSTPLPTNTPTPIVYSTVPAEPTVTPWPTYTFPTIVFTEPDPPDIEPINTPPPLSWQQTPDATADYQLDQIEGWGESISLMATRWYTTTNYALTFDPDTAMPITSTVPVTETSILGSGVNAPILAPSVSGESPTVREWLMSVPDNVAVLAGYIKSPQFYMPHFWPLFFFLLVAFAIILFVSAFRFAMKMVIAAYKFFGWHIEKVPVVE